MIIEKLMKQADFTDVEKSIAAYLMKNGFDVKNMSIQSLARATFRRHLLLQDFVESWDWMDIKNFRFCFIQNMKHLQIRA